MNPTAIFSKTGKGVQEATGKTSNLSRADRAVLSAVDGKTNVGALYKKFDKTPEPKFHQLLERLDREGYIREASPGVASQPVARPSAPPAAKPMDAVSDLDFTGVFSPVRPSQPSVPKAPPSVPKAPPIDFAARARAEAEKREQAGAFDYKARQAAEAKAKAEAEARARDAASMPAKVEDDSRIRAEAEEKLKAAQEMALRVAAEEKAQADKARAEAEAKAELEEAERKRKEEEARKAREEAERKRREEEEARKRKEEEERKRKEEEERKRREEEEARRRQEEEARKAREEAERKRKEEEERKRREEEEARRRKEEEERKRREEEERRRREEEEARRRKEEEARKAREEAERKRKEEEERKRRAEEEARRRKEEEDRRRREEEDARRRKEEEERKRREEEEERRRRQEEEEAAAASGGDSFADDLLADLDSFSQRAASERKSQEDSQRGSREAAARKAKEQAEHEARAKREERDRRRRPEESAPRPRQEAVSEGRAKRRLAAIVAADVVGYSRLMGIDEEGTLGRFKRMMREIVQPKVEEHSGRIVKTAGDGLLIEFPSVVDAVRFAVQVQTSVANEEADVAQSRQIAFRMGVNLGDIIGEDNDVYGDGVNVAARLEALADRGGICIAGVVFDQIRDKVTYSIEALGEQKLKNIPRPVRAYKIKGDWETTRLRRAVDPGSLPRPSGRGVSGPASEDDDIVVSDDDLNLDEVRLDEQILTKESRKAARKRAREEKKQLKAKQKAEKEAEKLAKKLAAKPVKIRRPRKWGKPVAVTLVLALVVGAGVVQFMPVDTAPFAQAASAALGRKVVVGSAHYSLLGGLDLEFEGVSIGKIRIAKVRAYPELSTVLGQRKAFRRLELVDALVPQNELADVLLGALKPVGFTVSRVEAKQLTLSGPVELPQVDVAADIGIDGAIASVKVSGKDNLRMTLRPKGGHVELDGTAGAFYPPFAPNVTLTDFSFKGSATRDGITLSQWDGAVLEGTLAGTAQIVWGPTWSVSGSLKAKNINAAVFAPALLSEGVGAGSGRFEMQGKVPGKLGDTARIQGSFTVGRGVLGSFDLSRIIRTSGVHFEGRTQFASLAGKVAYDSGATALRDVNLAAGALNADAVANIAPNGRLSGRIVADIKTAGHVLRSTIVLGGTVKQPEVKK